MKIASLSKRETGQSLGDLRSLSATAAIGGAALALLLCSCSPEQGTQSLDHLLQTVAEGNVIGAQGVYHAAETERSSRFEGSSQWVTNQLASSLRESRRVKPIPWEVSYELRILFEGELSFPITIFRGPSGDAHAFKISEDYYQCLGLSTALQALVPDTEVKEMEPGYGP